MFKQFGFNKKKVGCKKKTNIFFAFSFIPSAKTKDNILIGILNSLRLLFISITTQIPIEWVKQMPLAPFSLTL
jgi:hypothetical protein